MAAGIRSFAVLELSQAAYDEIERKLLEAGYDHLFQQGPGSMIDMAGIAVTLDARSCTCHPLDAPTPCQRKFALSACRAAAGFDGGDITEARHAQLQREGWERFKQTPEYAKGYTVI